MKWINPKNLPKQDSFESCGKTYLHNESDRLLLTISEREGSAPHWFVTEGYYRFVPGIWIKGRDEAAEDDGHAVVAYTRHPEPF